MREILFQIQIEKAIRNHKTNLELGKVPTTNEIRNAIRWVMRDNPDIFWFAHQYRFDEVNSTIRFQYTFSADRVMTIQQSIKDVIDNDFCIEYVKTLDIQEQIAYVYKWLVTYCSYNANSAYNQSIYSVFVRRNSVCTGYAKAAQYLFNLLGIESRLVFGRLQNDKEDGRHCWNLVKVDNQYYHFDACFGDSILDSVAINSGVKELFKVDGINYNFLCVSTDEILETRSIEDITTLPECPTSWQKTIVKSLAQTKLKQRDEIKGCLLSHIGSSADIHLCSKNKNTVLKVFRKDSKTSCKDEMKYMQQLKGCQRVLQLNEKYTDVDNDIIAIEQSTPLVDLIGSHYYELSLCGLLKMAKDIAMAWIECKNKGVIYRDIHICNIYRSNDGTFKLGDFGSCTNDKNLRETIENQWFMAPETYIQGAFSEASAVYSISMVIYFILNGLKPMFWKRGYEDNALTKRMEGDYFSLPLSCISMPNDTQSHLNSLFKQTLKYYPNWRMPSIPELIALFDKIITKCKSQDIPVIKKGDSLDFDADRDNQERIENKYRYISRDAFHKFHKFHRLPGYCCAARPIESSPIPEPQHSIPQSENQVMPGTAWAAGGILGAIGRFFNRAIGSKTKSHSSHVVNSNTYAPNINSQTESSLVYSSIFAPAEIKPKSHMIVQVYLHLHEETETIKSLAKESDRNAERRDYIPLSLKLRKGDKVDIEFNVYGETRLLSEHKSVIWQGSFTKCSFDYFVPKDMDIEELSCEANMYVNGALISEMRFITRIVESPRKLNPEVLSKTFKKIFISYAHQDIQQVKHLALAYKAQGVDYFFDRDKLDPGDVYEEKIFDYIDASDLFILCWSKNAEASEYVAKEKAHAMTHAYPQLSRKDATIKIYPVSMEPKAPIPEDMIGIYNFGEI